MYLILVFLSAVLLLSLTPLDTVSGQGQSPVGLCDALYKSEAMTTPAISISKAFENVTVSATPFNFRTSINSLMSYGVKMIPK